MKDMGMAQVKAKKKLMEICGAIISFAKRGRVLLVQSLYYELLGACAIYQYFIEEDVKNYVVYAQRFLETVCEERGEDYKYIMHLALAW